MPAHVLQSILNRHLSTAHQAWLNERLELIRTANSDRQLHITLGLIPRKLGRQDLELTAEDHAAAERARPGWSLTHWTVDMAARILVLLHLENNGSDNFGRTFADLTRTADLSESIALYRGTAVFGPCQAVDRQIGDGLRTNMRAIFEAIAHHNPYPRDQFDTNRWNHMVLKALFIDSTLHPIIGLDERANEELASILCDYAHERWAAGRAVSIELWRCVGPYATTDQQLNDLQRVSQSTLSVERQAAALALSQCPHPEAAAVLNTLPLEVRDIAAGKLDWSALSKLQSSEQPLEALAS